MDTNDETIRELRRLVEVIDDTVVQLERVRRRAQEIEQRRLAGDRYRVIVEAEERPLIVESLSEVLDRLSVAAGAFRRAEAVALAREGWTHERIGQFFGVTRQRIGSLIGRENWR
ncbi:MAG: helix-turn-helix domain-containing protein [Frankia sp.]|nr:helix-turn-helix domain-containing protein [Frankia sp.]